MSFNNFTENMADLFDETISSTEKDKIIHQYSENIGSANDLENLRQTVAALTPTIEIKANKNLKSSVMKQIENNLEIFPDESAKIKQWFSWQKIASIAAILLVFLAIIPIFGPKIFETNAKAMSLLNNSMDALLNIKSLIINYQVRSISGDNLDLIDIKGDFIDYTLYKEFTPIEKWRIEKPGTALVMDGYKQYLYKEQAGIGYVGNLKTNFVDWLKILLDPEKILQEEKSEAAKHNNDYSIEKTNSETVLTVKAKALGNFKDTFRLNKSIHESNTRRVYHFDKTTNRLNALEIFVNENGNEIQILKIDEIKYDEPIAPEKFKIILPEGMNWVEMNELSPKAENASIAKTAEEATKLWWESLSKEDWPTVYKLNPSCEKSADLESNKEYYGKSQIISIGTSFKSGLYPGKFVPYKVKLKSGEILGSNLCVRNDNPQKAWMIDGGY
jgi:hypothetical protein